jgi:hypothetical protein
VPSLALSAATVDPDSFDVTRGVDGHVYVRCDGMGLTLRLSAAEATEVRDGLTTALTTTQETRP